MIHRYKPLEIGDKEEFNRLLRQAPPPISELTFTNLFMWRYRYRPCWRVEDDCLLVLLAPEDRHPFGLQPAGPGDGIRALHRLADDLASLEAPPIVRRVSEELANRASPGDFRVEYDRDNSDYVYLAEDLVHLAGRKYHRKKNHLNRFVKNNVFEYRPLDVELVECFLEMQESWCQIKACEESPGLLMEDYAIRQALIHFEDLDFQGGAIVMDDQVEAFALGEPLDDQCAVIHIEKANPDIPGLYAAVNQMFCRQAFSGMRYINREQDMGIEGLRKAKESYYPHHLVNKYTLERAP